MLIANLSHDFFVLFRFMYENLCGTYTEESESDYNF